MTTPSIPNPTEAEPLAAELSSWDGVILKSPKLRGVVASVAGVVGLGLTASTAVFSSLGVNSPAWLLAAYAVYGVLAPAAFGIWKANIR